MSQSSPKIGEEVLVRLGYLQIDATNLALVPEKIYENFVQQVDRLKKECLGAEPIRTGKVYPLIISITNRTSHQVISGILEMEMVIPGWKNQLGSSFTIKGDFPLPEIKKGETEKIILMELSEIPLIKVFIKNGQFQEAARSVDVRMTGHRKFFFKRDVDFMISSTSTTLENREDEETIEYIEREVGFGNYLLIKSYLDLNVYARGILLRVLFDHIDDIENNRIRYELKEPEKLIVKHILQIDIISKISMMIEDLGLFSVGLLGNIRDLHRLFFSRTSSQKVADFYGRIESVKDEEFLRILGFPTIDSLSLPEEDRSIVNKVLHNVHKEARRVYSEIAKFRKTHLTLYNKYKHGFTLVPYAQKTGGYIPFLRDVSSTIVVLHDEKLPMKNVITIPYSPRALEGYKILIAGIQTLLKNILENNRNKMENPNITNLPMAGNNLTAEERSRYEKIAERFRPAAKLQREHRIDIQTSAKRKDLQWYVDLEEFLEECRKRAEVQS